jgi:pimeloyl-ACP methyl ester carboxylesterase
MIRGGELDVVLVHGVGLAPAIFDRLIDHLPDMHVTTPRRPTYRTPAGPAPTTVEHEAAMLLDEWTAASDRPLLVVGVSGGATLAVAMAATGHPRLAGVVAHEPLIGRLAPELHEAVVAAADRLSAGDEPAPERAVAFVAGLVGQDTWAQLPSSTTTFPADHAAAVLDEVPRFTAFAPSVTSLRSGAALMTITTGSRSHARRHAAAAVLADAGARTEVVPGAGHLAPWEAPTDFAAVIRAAADRALMEVREP